MATRNQITIRQVAKEAGVSAQTVSRVINDHPDVAPETRRRVERVITALGYQPNAIARSLIHQRSQSIGVVAMASEHFGPSRTLVGIEKQSRNLGYTLLLDFLHHPEIENVEQILNRLLSRQVDGIIWAVPEIGSNRSWLLDKAYSLPVPMIFISMHAEPGLAVAAIDNYRGARLATEHLLQQGYQNIGLITGPPDWWEAQQRRLGWQDALLAAGRPATQTRIAEGDWSASRGQKAFYTLVDQFPEIDAVFASNDQTALGVLHAAQREGRRVPEDLGVVGFDNIPESAFFLPPLTTVEQPLLELGSLAVEELGRIIQTEQQKSEPVKPGSLVLEPRIVIRESSVRNNGQNLKSLMEIENYEN